MKPHITQGQAVNEVVAAVFVITRRISGVRRNEYT
jgi:hypothetical protein